MIVVPTKNAILGKNDETIGIWGSQTPKLWIWATCFNDIFYASGCFKIGAADPKINLVPLISNTPLETMV